MSQPLPVNSPRRKRANTEYSLNQLIVTFENSYIKTSKDSNKNISENEWNELLVKETLRLKKKPAKRKAGDLFGSESTELTTDNFLSLDLAKKNRRIEQLLSKKADLKEELEEKILETIPEPRTLKDYNLANMGQLIIKTKDEDCLLELGDVETNFGKQVAALIIEVPRKELSKYYSTFIYDQTNEPMIFLGSGDKTGPVVVSIESLAKAKTKAHLRAFVRSKMYDKWVFIPTSNKNTKDIITALKEQAPDLVDVKFEKARDSQIGTKLLKLEEVLNERPMMKVGVIYIAKGQTSEDEFYSNERGSPEFDDFLNFLGDKIQLKGWNKFAGGLDTQENLTGINSYFTEFAHFQIMFHVSTLLPYSKLDTQQVEKKRHIGNDSVTIVFVDPGHYFDPSWIVSDFLHIFLVVSPVLDEKDKRKNIGYRMSVATRPNVRPFGPRVPFPNTFVKSDDFRNFLLTKVINSEAAALQAPAFKEKIKRTKDAFLKELIKANK
jgi:hypothetical protein